MIHLQTLGTLDLLDRADGHQVMSVLVQPKRVGFLTYLALASPRGLRQRDTLLAVFWPDSTDKRARNALNQTVFTLRRALGQDLFAINGDSRIGVDSDYLSCDVWEFEAALEDGKKEYALDLYKGNYLEGFFLPGCLDFERWVESERGRLQDLARGAALSLAREMESAGNPVGALGWLRRARVWAPYDELLLRTQVELLLSLGDRSGAVREYECFSRRLSTDLGVEPSPEVELLLKSPAAPSRPWPGIDQGRGPDPTVFPPDVSQGAGAKGRRRFFLPQTVGLALLAGAIGVGSAVFLPRLWADGSSRSGLSGMGTDSRRNVAVLPLENATSSPALEPLGLISSEGITQELATMGLAGVWPVSGSGPGNLSDADYLVTGSISDRDEQLVFQARILDAESGRIVVAVDTVMAVLDSAGVAIDRLGHRVAGAMTMALDPEISDLAMVASHPPSFEAYQLLADGRDMIRRLSLQRENETRTALRDSAVHMFLEAADRDSGFTLPRILVLEAGPSAEYESQLQFLRDRRDKLPPFERALLDLHLADAASDLSEQRNALLRVVRLAPSPGRKLRLAVVSAESNRPRGALEILSELESDRDFLTRSSNYWMYLADVKLVLGDYEGVLADIERSRAFYGQGNSLPGREVEALARMGRVEEATERAMEILQTTGHPGTQFLTYYLPRILRASGSEEGARLVAEVGVASFSRIEGASPSYAAAALVSSGRYAEARDLLSRSADSIVRPMMAYTLLAYMAAREGDAEEAIRQSEMAANVNVASGGGRGPYGVMSQVEVAAHLGDNAGAVRLLREAYQLGLPHGPYIFTRWDLRPLQGYQPFEDMMRPKG